MSLRLLGSFYIDFLMKSIRKSMLQATCVMKDWCSTDDFVVFVRRSNIFQIKSIAFSMKNTDFLWNSNTFSRKQIIAKGIHYFFKKNQ